MIGARAPNVPAAFVRPAAQVAGGPPVSFRPDVALAGPRPGAPITDEIPQPPPAPTSASAPRGGDGLWAVLFAVGLLGVVVFATQARGAR